MLKLTRKTEYALIALRYFQRQKLHAVVTAKEISHTYNIPYPLLAKILQALAKKNFLEPVHGAKGGYKMRANLKNISLMEFFEKIEGPFGIMDCSIDENCELVSLCNIRSPIQKINRTLRKVLGDITLQEITI